MIEAARKRLSSQPNVRFAVGDMHELPFAAAGFDQVLFFNTLHLRRSAGARDRRGRARAPRPAARWPS